MWCSMVMVDVLKCVKMFPLEPLHYHRYRYTAMPLSNCRVPIFSLLFTLPLLRYFIIVVLIDIWSVKLKFRLIKQSAKNDFFLSSILILYVSYIYILISLLYPTHPTYSTHRLSYIVLV